MQTIQGSIHHFEYIIVFLHTENVPKQHISFEIDKDEMRFTTKGLEFLIDCLSFDDPRSPSTPQNGEILEMDIELHHAFFGNGVETVRSFITNANNREHLVHGKLENGGTGLSLAPSDSHVDMVMMLQENGPDLNCRNVVGRALR